MMKKTFLLPIQLFLFLLFSVAFFGGCSKQENEESRNINKSISNIQQQEKEQQEEKIVSEDTDDTVSQKEFVREQENEGL